MDLFEHGYQKTIESEQPLAARMRPRNLEEFIGQEHIVGKGRLLYRAIAADQLTSLIFYGPPGTGKTSLAAVIANATKSHFVTVNAVLAGVKEIREVVSGAQERRKLYNQKTILFVDEVHRWNKAQQDALLPWVENGTVILIGATIENPYFEVNRALVSRSRIFQLKPLDHDELKRLAMRALEDGEKGYGRFNVTIDRDALEHLVNVANGDARSLLNALELAVETTPPRYPPKPGEPIHIDISVAEESIQRRVVLYDKEGDYHFDTISAFIKSLRGSDPDASLYWLAKMVYAGEDPHYIFRRMLIFASEDVGLADPNALVVTQAAAAAFDRVGMPEGRFHLSHAALYLATALKSNSTMAFFDALSTVEKGQEGPIPKHLKDGSRDSESFGHGEGYLYPHAYTQHWVAQQYLPAELQGKTFYQPGDLGYESRLKETIETRREAQLAVMLELNDSADEILTFTPANRARDQWLARASGSLSRFLQDVRSELFEGLPIRRHAVALDLRGGNGFITWELQRKTPEGGVFTVIDEKNLYLPALVKPLPDLERPHLLVGDLLELHRLLQGSGQEDIRFDIVVGRNALGLRAEKGEILRILYQYSRPGAVLRLGETVPRWGQRLSELTVSHAGKGSAVKDSVDEENRDSPDAANGSQPQTAGGVLKPDLLEKLRRTEDEIYGNPENPAVNWDDEILRAEIRNAGFSDITIRRKDYTVERLITHEELQKWLRPEVKGKGLLQPGYLTDTELQEIHRVFIGHFANQWVSWRRSLAFADTRKPAG